LVQRPSDQKRHKALHGLYRALINNMVVGVTEGYKIQQELVGVGYRATNTGNTLDLVLGYSHHYVFELPKKLKLQPLLIRVKTQLSYLNQLTNN
jgi:large subunit ribosomal protein L6